MDLNPNWRENCSVLFVITVFPSISLKSLKSSGKTTSPLRLSAFRISYCKTSIAKFDFAATRPPAVVPWMLK